VLERKDRYVNKKKKKTTAMQFIKTGTHVRGSLGERMSGGREAKRLYTNRVTAGEETNKFKRMWGNTKLGKTGIQKSVKG